MKIEQIVRNLEIGLKIIECHINKLEKGDVKVDSDTKTDLYLGKENLERGIKKIKGYENI